MTQEQAILELARRQGAIRARDIAEHGLSRSALRRLYRRGALDCPTRGLYVLPGADVSENHALAEASKLVPAGVVCLLSALRFHDLTTEDPRQVWIAVGAKAWKPHVATPPLRIMRFSPATLEFGVETHLIEGVAVLVFCPAKTVADCFKYRNKIGLDVAIAALRDCLRQRRASVDQLWMAAKVCRMTNVMRPYLEAIL